MEKDFFTIEHIVSKLDEYKDGYDLCGCEMSTEDAEEVIDLINDGYTEDEAINLVLCGIYDVISEGWED